MVNQRLEDVCEQSLEVINDGSVAIKLYIEPWGMEVEMPKGKKLQVHFYSPIPGSIDVWYSDGAITIGGWPQTRYEVRDRGQIVCQSDIRPGTLT